MKRTLFLGLLALWLLTAAALPARAAGRTVPVTVDDALLSGASYVDSGVTSVPLRTLLERLGGWEVFWDAQTQSAVAVSGGDTLVAKPGEAALTLNETTYAAPAAVYVQGGRTYVPLRAVCGALGLEVTWSDALGGAAVSTGEAPAYDDTDLYWLSRIISAESRGESLAGQIAVGNVVLNRVASRQFPNTVRGVVFDRKDGLQFEPVQNGTIYAAPTPRSLAAAKAALAGTKTVGQCLYFYAPALSPGRWIRANRTYAATIGCHRFYL